MKYDYMIVSRWRNKRSVTELVDKIRAKGKTVYSFFEADDFKQTLKESGQKLHPEEFMQKFESIPDWKNNPQVREIFDIDMKALRDAETVIFLLPAGKSAHIEAGLAYSLGKKLIVIDEQKETESLYLIFNEFYNTIDDFIKSI